jgi:2-desacetyl-2-hydroxyethyl bacteriochlorophyllide A dehydrogenase
MKYAAIEAPGKVVLKKGDLPSIGKDELLVKVMACGVCTATDLHYMNGELETNFPLTGANSYFGHELSGIVVETGAGVTEFKKGDRVSFLKGGYQEYAVADKSLTVKIPDGLDFVESLAEPLAVSLNTLNLTQVQKNEDIVVLGTGFMGLLLIQGLRGTGVKEIIAVDLLDPRLALAKRFGATRTINAKNANVESVVNEITKGRGVDTVIEAAGAPPALALAPQLVKPGGKIIVHGFYPKPVTINMVPWHVKGLTIVNAHPTSVQKYKSLMAEGLTFLKQHRFEIDPLVTHRFTLDQMDEVYRLLQSPGEFIKIAVLPNAERSKSNG